MYVCAVHSWCRKTKNPTISVFSSLRQYISTELRQSDTSMCIHVYIFVNICTYIFTMLYCGLIHRAFRVGTYVL